MKLPIDAHLEEIRTALAEVPLLLLEAPPGTGKTTRVPPALLTDLGQVWVLEPRRMAARWACHTIANQHGWQVGREIGYQVRLDDRSSPETRLLFMTAGVFARRLLSNPTLRGVAVVVLDEFHERSLENDLALAWVRSLSEPPRLLLMSATLPPELDLGPRLHCPAPHYPVEQLYRPNPDPLLENRVLEAMREAGTSRPGEHTLIFLPGMAEMRACQRKLEGLAQRQKAELVILHGSLPAAEQDRLLAPCSDQTRWILSTNVAETSLTIPGVRVVVDSGLARSLRYRGELSTPALETGRISQSSAVQRAGRAGRTGPGRCLRLYTEGDFRSRPAQTPAEIHTADLSGLALLLQRLRRETLPWHDPPEESRWQAARALLERLGAIREGDLTALGEKMAEIPLSPRLARLLVACPTPLAAAAASLIEERAGKAPYDVLEAAPKAVGLPMVTQLRRYLGAKAPLSLPQALLAAFPDRVARLRRGRDLMLCDGQAWPAQGVQDLHEGWLLALDAEQNLANRTLTLRAYSWIEPEWLLDRPEVSEEANLEWNAQAGRVEKVERLCYLRLTLDETRRPAPPGPESARILAQRAVETPWWRKLEAALEELEVRLALLPRLGYLGVVPLDRPAVLEQACQQVTSLRELENTDNPLYLLPAAVRASLDQLTPTHVSLPGGRRLRVHYTPHSPPWIESRLVDFFNLKDGPRIGRGQMPLTLHLLAPNNRPVQVTSDLAGFWERHYPKIRQELSRRYPRHYWPENPLEAQSNWRPPPRK